MFFCRTLPLGIAPIYRLQYLFSLSLFPSLAIVMFLWQPKVKICVSLALEAICLLPSYPLRTPPGVPKQSENMGAFSIAKRHLRKLKYHVPLGDEKSISSGEEKPRCIFVLHLFFCDELIESAFGSKTNVQERRWHHDHGTTGNNHNNNSACSELKPLFCDLHPAPGSERRRNRTEKRTHRGSPDVRGRVTSFNDYPKSFSNVVVMNRRYLGRERSSYRRGYDILEKYHDTLSKRCYVRISFTVRQLVEYFTTTLLQIYTNHLMMQEMHNTQYFQSTPI